MQVMSASFLLSSFLTVHTDAFGANSGGSEPVLDVPVFAHAELERGPLLLLEVLPGQLELHAPRVTVFLAGHRLGESAAGLGVASGHQLSHGLRVRVHPHALVQGR